MDKKSEPTSGVGYDPGQVEKIAEWLVDPDHESRSRARVRAHVSSVAEPPVDPARAREGRLKAARALREAHRRAKISLGPEAPTEDDDLALLEAFLVTVKWSLNPSGKRRLPLPPDVREQLGRTYFPFVWEELPDDLREKLKKILQVEGSPFVTRWLMAMTKREYGDARNPDLKTVRKQGKQRCHRWALEPDPPERPLEDEVVPRVGAEHEAAAIEELLPQLTPAERRGYEDMRAERPVTDAADQKRRERAASRLRQLRQEKEDEMITVLDARLERIEAAVADQFRAIDELAGALVWRYPDDEELAAAVENWRAASGTKAVSP